jgi:transketolase
MADRPGIVYLRTTREKTPVIYPADRPFMIGGSVVLGRTGADRAAIVAAGITVHEALNAQQVLIGEGIPVRIVDAYSVKPVDRDTLRAAAAETGAVVVAEDHWAEGGLGEAVLSALAGVSPPPRFVHLAVRTMPGSGTPQELLDAAGIGARAIAGAVRALIAAGPPAPAR